MKIFRFILVGALIAAKTASFSGDKILWKDDKNNGVTTKALILNQVLSTTDDTGYSGVAPICNHNGKHYILLSQEGNNGKASNTYCDFGGKVDKGETRGTASLRECYEESSRVYDFRNKSADFTRDARICYSKKLMTAFVDVPYQPRKVFMDALEVEKKKKHNGCYHEKSDFLWVDVKSLNDSIKTVSPQKGYHPQVSITFLKDDGSLENKTIKLRDFYAKTLKNSDGILKKYVPKSGPQVDPAIKVPQVGLPNIKAISSLKEISTGNFKKATLLLLDLDENLLIETIHSPKKYHHLIDPLKGYRLLENDIANTVQTLKNSVGGDGSNVTILGLTKRGVKKHGHFDKGHKHLKDNNVPTSRLRFSKHNGINLCGNSNAGFFNGVIYTDGKNKGDHLEHFLKITCFKPSHIVMSDDKPQNLIDVHGYAKKIGVSMEAYEMTGVKTLK